MEKILKIENTLNEYVPLIINNKSFLVIPNETKLLIIENPRHISIESPFPFSKMLFFSNFYKDRLFINKDDENLEYKIVVKYNWLYLTIASIVIMTMLGYAYWKHPPSNGGHFSLIFQFIVFIFISYIYQKMDHTKIKKVKKIKAFSMS